jgi:hypothetical protein
MGSRVLDVGDTGPSSSTLQLTQFKPAGINSLASRPNAYNALDFVMGALRATHPHMLEELRDVT